MRKALPILVAVVAAASGIAPSAEIKRSESGGTVDLSPNSEPGVSVDLSQESESGVTTDLFGGLRPYKIVFMSLGELQSSRRIDGPIIPLVDSDAHLSELFWKGLVSKYLSKELGESR
jgi:hypothetical protein